ncbi:MAG: ImmA/IrrE family metallo-endopeptidase [Acidobacteria bacterium]|nr:ImmA/IrrE family metallo-endopeptidase [Acidobacteriota bacterium]
MDFRLQRGPLSRETLLSIRRARAIQTFSTELGQSFAPIYWKQDPDAAKNAIEARKWLDFSEEDQLGLKDSRLTFIWLQSKLASLGIDVLVHKYPSSDAKAYCFAENPPLVVISSNDPHLGSRLFSLLHELCHLANGSSGLCSPEERLWNYAQERQCDKFATHLLMPERLVRRLAGDSMGAELADRVDELSAMIKCSKTALLIRFEELGLTSPAETAAKIRELRDRSPQKGRGSSSRKSNLLRDSGLRFSSQVFDAYSRDVISVLDASRMLNLNQGAFEEIGTQLGRL